MKLSAIGALALVLAACDSDTTDPPQSKTDSSKPTSGWTYEARFPGPTAKKKTPIPTPAGVLQSHTETFEDGNGALGVQWFDYPEHTSIDDPTRVLEASARGAAQNTRSVIRELKPTRVQGMPAMLLLADLPKRGAYKATFVLAGRRQFAVYTATEKARLEEARVRALFESFRLVKSQ